MKSFLLLVGVCLLCLSAKAQVLLNVYPANYAATIDLVSGQDTLCIPVGEFTFRDADLIKPDTPYRIIPGPRVESVVIMVHTPTDKGSKSRTFEISQGESYVVTLPSGSVLALVATAASLAAKN